MKILLVSPNTLRKNTAGVEQSVYYLAHFLQKKKVGVRVLATAEHPAGNVEYKTLSLIEVPRFAPNNAYFFSPEVYSVVQQSDADIVHAYGSNNLVSLLALMAKKPAQKFILTGASSISSSPFRKLLHAPMYALYRLFAHKMDALICVSEYEQSLFEKEFRLPKRKYVRIPNGIDLPAIRKIREKKVPFTILTVARLVKQKGVHRLIAAMPLILAKQPKAVLHVVGDGVERANLENQVRGLGIEKSVVFHGHIQFEDNEKLLQLFGRAHVFSLLADSESQGLVYGMGVASKCHVVATHSSAMTELIAANAARGIQNPDSAEEVSGVMLSCFSKPAPKVDVDTVVWSWDRVGDAVLALYHRLSKE